MPLAPFLLPFIQASPIDKRVKHQKFYPDDLAPGYILTPDSLADTHRRILKAFAHNREHAQTLATTPWAAAALLKTAQEAIQGTLEPIYDFDLAFNYWNWIYQFSLYGQDHALHWDRLEQMVYPRLEDPMLNQFCLTQGLAFIENSTDLIRKWQPLLPSLLDQLQRSGVRVICNHATWMSQGILIILFYHALQTYCANNPAERKRVERLGLFDPMEMGTRVNTLLGPWITTLGFKLNPAISDLNAMTGVQAMSNVVKVFPDTPSGRFECCAQRWQGEVRKALKHLRGLEIKPGNLIFETPSGGQDMQKAGKLIPGKMPKAAVRLARSRPNQLILVGMDERHIFDKGVQEGGFTGGIMQPGKVGFTLKSYMGLRPENSNPDWPFAHWQELEPTVAGLIHDPEGNKIGQATHALTK